MTDKKPELSAAMKIKWNRRFLKKSNNWNKIYYSDFSAKGGVGKSTFATSLAVALKELDVKLVYLMEIFMVHLFQKCLILRKNLKVMGRN